MQQIFAKVAANLQKNGFAVETFANGADAVTWLAQQTPKGEKAAFGGSVTLTQLNLAQALTGQGVQMIDYRSPDYTPEELYNQQRQVFFAHTYFSSANALTQDGHILNVDGNGNRVAATIFGPKQVIFVIGRNKLVEDMPAAIKRMEEVAAPLNCKRLDCSTPCKISGKCEHCGVKTSICRAWTVLAYPPRHGKYQVALIDEDLGY